ncbi:hypothetical protein N7G274_002316 [Stereocaulon virgatum]|uniref:Uncharacterized protein n=1 Tax=Stereocaulon virgatum TaxID=373712 RepID=A0ABR4AP92_9LECA
MTSLPIRSHMNSALYNNVASPKRGLILGLVCVKTILQYFLDSMNIDSAPLTEHCVYELEVDCPASQFSKRGDEVDVDNDLESAICLTSNSSTASVNVNSGLPPETAVGIQMEGGICKVLRNRSPSMLR